MVERGLESRPLASPLTRSPETKPQLWDVQGSTHQRSHTPDSTGMWSGGMTLDARQNPWGALKFRVLRRQAPPRADRCLPEGAHSSPGSQWETAKPGWETPGWWEPRAWSQSLASALVHPGPLELY